MSLNFVKNYTDSVWFLKRFFAISLLIFLMLLLGWPLLQSLWVKVQLSSLPKDFSLVENYIERPTLASQTNAGEAYILKALRAKNINDNLVTLMHPQGQLFPKGEWVDVHAQEGMLDQAKALLTLNNQVVLRNYLGYQLQATKILVDLRNQTLESNQPVQVFGPLGTAQGQGLSFKKKEKTLILKGRSRLIIYQKPLPKRGH